MQFSITTLWLICLISSGSAKLSSFQQPEESDSHTAYNSVKRDTSFFHSYKSTNRTHQNQAWDLQKTKNQREVSSNPESWRSQNTDSRRNPGNYDHMRIRGNFSPSNRYDHNEPKTRTLKTYGRGKAHIMKNGQAVNVPNEMRQNTYVDTATPKAPDQNENEIKPIRHKGVCKECPVDQSVVATKGNPFAILPEPCPLNPRMWNHHSGPRPGSKIREGVHSVRGYIGPKKKFCQYHYQVIVRRCEPLQSKEEMVVKCSAENSWGSVCNVSCDNEKEPIGLTNLECKEDLTWSNPLPICKSKNDCSTHKVKADSKISCHTADMEQVNSEIASNGSTCKFLQNGKEVNIICKDGRWKMLRKDKKPLSKKNKPKSSACNPDPCQNGGSCFKSESNSEPICKCRPQTFGVRCELRECYYNICQNNGLCFIQNNERICYCSPEFNGDVCQNYTP